MPQLYQEPVRIPVPGGKVILEHIGAASTGESAVSIARMVAPSGWSEPAQTPVFDEFTVVTAGALLVESGGETVRVEAGQAIKTAAGERVRYSVGEQGAEYFAVCLPAFTPEGAGRDE